MLPDQTCYPGKKYVDPPMPLETKQSTRIDLDFFSIPVLAVAILRSGNPSINST